MDHDPELTMVSQFYQAMGFKKADKPSLGCWDDLGRLHQRFQFIQEETRELYLAARTFNKVETLDALVDLVYVIKGTVLELGLGAAWAEAMRRVHAANMAKQPGVTDRGQDALKPSDWQAPDLSDLVQDPQPEQLELPL